MDKKLMIIWVVAITAIWYTSYSNYTLQQEIKKTKLEMQVLKQPSQIEKMWDELKKAIIDSKIYSKKEIEYKNKKEQAIWKTRCLKKKIIWEEKWSCKKELDRFASYNLKKN